MERDSAFVKIKTLPPGPNVRKWTEFLRRYAARSTYHGGVHLGPLQTGHRSLLYGCGWKRDFGFRLARRKLSPGL